MKSKVLKIDVEGGSKFIEIEGSENEAIPLTTLQNEVGGYVTTFNLRRIGLPEIDVYVDEEGIINARPMNRLATLLTGIHRYGDALWGDAVFCSHDKKGETIGLSDQQLRLLTLRLNRIVMRLGKNGGAR